MDITYHLVPKAYFEALDASKDYLPAAFGREGFIHCTDGEFFVSRSAYNHLRALEGELLVLFIDKEKLKSPMKYEDEEKIFPHIYGPLNRDAIVKVSSMIRDRKGEWIFPAAERLPE